MDYCDHKLAEAKYFFEKMQTLENEGNLLEFTYNLSAFLSAARSITTYVKDKAKKPRQKQEIEDLVDKNSIIRFLVNQRNYTVHRKLLELSAQVNTDLQSVITIKPAESISAEMYTVNEKGEEIVHLAFTEPEYHNVSFNGNTDSVVTSYHFTFNEWSGHEGILELSNNYLKWLKEFIFKINSKISFE
ncbi:hypothetical protein F9802_10165 [Bacillus aerolatus]|uniref:Uncharacterized protein n=1 Tax=Bacillus aerolatus TaxID=2653354 RepID=A0A6I1FF39_9BACI|nr:hypothetical protein [Bacillus aerolatus]KAB7706555.1 hypothetical protein F9802_10165 [Bacillus aerolatus]